MGKDVSRMAYQKYVYNRINWENKSDSLATPLGKTNLNKMDSAIYNIAENLDVVQNDLGSGKLDKSDAGKMIVGMPAWNPNTGVLSFRFYDGTIFQVDFNVEKIPVSFSMDSAGVITMATSDGTQWTADIGDVVPDYAFVDSDTIAFQMGYEWDASAYSGVSDYGYGPPENWGIGENMGKSYVDKATGIMYTCVFSHGAFSVVERQLSRAGGNRSLCANIRKNSITGEHLRPDYLADITVKAGDAAASAKEASDFADDAAFDAQLAQSYAVGGSGVRQGEDADNAKKYKELCQDIFDNFQQAGSVTGVKGAKESGFRHGNVSISPEDIGAVAKEDIANNLVTTNAGWALDARQGKVLKDEINQRFSFEKKNTNIGNTFDISRYMVDNWAMLVIGRVTSAVPDSGFIFFVSGVEKSFVHVAPIHAAGNCASVAVSNGILTIKYMTGDGNAFIIPFNQ